MGNFNVEMFYNKECGKQVFYVRPFSKEAKAELERLEQDASQVCGSISITNKNGTYAIATDDEITPSTFTENFWGMLFRKFLSESHTVCIDPLNDEKFYSVIFSADYIPPCNRKLAA